MIREKMRRLRCTVISLGCPKNLVDSEQMLGLLEQHQFSIVYEPEEADVVILNTCGFLSASRDESLAHINELSRRRRNKKDRLCCLVVAGCLVQRDRETLKMQCPDVDVFLDVFSREKVVQAVCDVLQLSDNAVLENNIPEVFPSCGENKTVDLIRGGTENRLPIIQEVRADVTSVRKEPLFIHGVPNKVSADVHRHALLPPHVAYLKIAEGCNRRCSFCMIPFIRGKLVSKPLDMLEEEARRLAESGVRELVLIAQDTTCYGVDIFGKSMLPELLKRLSEIQSLRWIRLMYLYPMHITDELITALSTLPKILPYLDIPLQHINDGILHAMRRDVTRNETETLLNRLRGKVPNLVIRTSFIVGFPGETQHEFNELKDFLQQQRFHRVGVFPFSAEPGTHAYSLPNQVPEKIIQKRYDQLMRLAQEISAESNRRLIGKTLDVILDMEIKDHLGFPVEARKQLNSENHSQVWVGRSIYDAPDVDGLVYVTSTGLHVGEIVPCEVVAADMYDLTAVAL